MNNISSCGQNTQAAPEFDKELQASGNRQRRLKRSPVGTELGLLYPDLALAIEYLPIEAVAPYARNARTHSKRQIRQIAESIRAFGIVSPLVCDASGELIAGHGRLAAAQLLGCKTMPVVRIDHLDEAQKRALRIADNRLAELAGWDSDLLSIEFKDLVKLDFKVELDFDLAITGFASPEIDRFVESGGPAAGPAAEDDAAVTVGEGQPSVSRIGDAWVLGDHRLLCGDARATASYATLLGSAQATLVLTDPPYNVPINRHVCGLGKIRHDEFVMASGEMNEAQFTAFLTDCLNQTMAHAVAGAIQFVCMDWRHIGEMVAAGRACGLELKNLCVWNKDNGGMGSLYRSQHELVFVWKKPGAPHINNIELGRFGRYRSNVWSYPGVNTLRPDRMEELATHPTCKPVALVADAIRDCSHRGDIVLDPFCGSGTILIAAAKTGRRAYALELDPRYVDAAVRRWEKWSGQSARHAETGLTFAETQAQHHPITGSTVNEAVDAAPPQGGVRVRRRPSVA